MPRLPIILVVAMLSAFGLIASDVYLPAMPAMAAEFTIADWQMPQTVSAYLFMLAVTQLVYGPLSDHWGRKRVLIAGIIIYIG
ncbi:multidrug transporter CflA, partial [Aquitalea magnusonii]